MPQTVNDGAHNLFDLPLAQDNPLYRNTMLMGINRIIDDMTGRKVTLYTLGNEGLETVLSDSKETSEEKENDTLDYLFFLATLSNGFLPEEELKNSIVATWRNDGLAFFSLYPQDSGMREKMIQEKIEKGYTSLMKLIAETPEGNQENIDGLFEIVKDYLYAILNGTLYASKEFRGEGRAIQEALFIRTKMTSLVALCLQKQKPEFLLKENLSEFTNAVETYLTDNYPYSMVLESFKCANDQTDQLMLNWGEYGGIWSEHFFGYHKAQEIIKKREHDIFLVNHNT